MPDTSWYTPVDEWTPEVLEQVFGDASRAFAQEIHRISVEKLRWLAAEEQAHSTGTLPSSQEEALVPSLSDTAAR